MLSYDDYKRLGGQHEMTDFNHNVGKATDVIDAYTRRYYRVFDIDKDITFRREQFLKAIVAQIDYFVDNGSNTTHGMSNPNTVSIGRTTVTQSTKGSVKTSTGHELLSDDALFYLSGTGLLYRGGL